MPNPDYKVLFEKFVHKYVCEHIKLYDTEQLVDSLIRTIENQHSHLNAYFKKVPPQDKSLAHERQQLKNMVHNVLERAKKMG